MPSSLEVTAMILANPPVDGIRLLPTLNAFRNGSMARHLDIKVLVVEDELIQRLDLAEAIELEGYEVSHVPSADDALELLEKDSSIGIVFTDIKMPGTLDGIELASVIRSRWPNISVVISSGNIASDPRCITLGAPMIPKPYRLRDLRTVLQEDDSTQI